ncbi:hypothetical protein ACIGHN_12765 [Acidovorax sp. NPDC077693]|uniref:hypothetical protein n=1 Tax=unclassified Acidovorax TaxID=2684926 RepID=UPI0037C5A3C9
MKNLPVLTSNYIRNDSDESRSVRQHIDAAKGARELMRRASTGDVQHVAPSCAKKFLAASVEIYDLLDQVEQRVNLEKRAGQLDQIFVLRLNAELDKIADELFVRAHLAMGSPAMAWMPGFVAGYRSLLTGGAN